MVYLIVNKYYEARIAEYKSYLGDKCVVCGGLSELEIDHIDWVKKSLNISKVWGNKNQTEVYKELDKCQLLCKEHHAQKTKADSLEQSALKTFTHGTMYGWMRKKCTCEECLSAQRIWYDNRNIARRKS